METRTGNGHHAKFERVCNDVRTVVRDSGALLEQSMHRAKHRAQQAIKETGDLVQERPLEMVAVVFGVGLLAGLVLFSLLSPKEER